ncbi:hypothetical protein [Wenjunlia tyrosinilytica]|uniref:hypothetical protein n=1 Tax=Wenjunlia tyrosinilytica TaxID=1544741 RepID=UPI0035709CC0
MRCIVRRGAHRVRTVVGHGAHYTGGGAHWVRTGRCGVRIEGLAYCDGRRLLQDFRDVLVVVGEDLRGQALDKTKRRSTRPPTPATAA